MKKKWSEVWGRRELAKAKTPFEKWWARHAFRPAWAYTSTFAARKIWQAAQKAK